MSKVYLNRGITLDDLQKGVEFEIDHEESNSSSDESFDDVRFDDFKKEIDSIEQSYSGNVPFIVLRSQMENVTEDGLVMKKLIKWGTGNVLPEKSVVMMHYEGFLENADQPFDSTRLRNKPYKVLLGDGNLVLGLELAVRTMKKNEISEFIVNSPYAYGPMGCPPRIPGGADILYRVEIINFYESKSVIEFEEMTPEEQKKASFDKVVAVFHCEHQMGNDLFRKKLYAPAIARYRRMVKLLEDVSVGNEDDDVKRKGYLLKLYLNLAQSYLNINKPRKALIYADLALKEDPENPKGLYRMGHALFLTDEFSRARHFLNKAKKHKPYEKSINALMIKLEQKQKLHREWEKNFCRSVFSSEKGKEEKVAVMPETKEFHQIIEDEIKAFLDSHQKELPFSSGFTEKQKEALKEIAKKYDLAYVDKIQNDVNIIKVTKRNSNSPH